MLSASKNFISELKKQKRENKSLLFLDNVKIIRDALVKGVIEVKYILTSLDETDFKALNIPHENIEVYHVDAKTIDMLSDTKTPQKVLCIAYHTQYVVEVPKTNFLVLDNLQDPGNVGTLIRSAKATGFEYVFLVDGVRKDNPKLIRSSVGAVFDNKIYEMSHEEFIAFAKQNKLRLISCDMNGENIFNFADKNNQSQPLGIVVGNEGQGVSDDMANLCFKTVKIPMKDGIESLNAGVSGSIIMYEINKNSL